MKDFEQLLALNSNGGQKTEEKKKPKRQIALLSAEIEQQSSKKREVKQADNVSEQLLENTTDDAITIQTVLENAKQAVADAPNDYKSYAFASSSILEFYFSKTLQKKEDANAKKERGTHMFLALEYIEKALQLLKKYSVANPKCDSNFKCVSSSDTEKQAKEKLLHNQCLLKQFLISVSFECVKTYTQSASDKIFDTIKSSDDLKKKIISNAKKASRPQGLGKIMYGVWAIFIFAFIAFFVKTIIAYVAKDKNVQGYLIYTCVALGFLIVFLIANFVKFRKNLKILVGKLNAKNKYLFALKLNLATSLLEFKKDYDLIVKKAGKIVNKFFIVDQTKVKIQVGASYSFTEEFFDKKRTVIESIMQNKYSQEFNLVFINKVKGITVTDDLKAHKFAIKILNGYVK